MIREYKTIEEVAGPLMLVKQVDGVKYDELGEIELPTGEIRRCRVLEVNGRSVLVQLFDSSAGMSLADSKVRFMGHGVELPVSEHMLGRVLDGMGEPIDGGAPIDDRVARWNIHRNSCYFFFQLKFFQFFTNLKLLSTNFF